VLELGTIQFVIESFQVGEPLEFGRVHREPTGEIPRCFDDGKIPPLSGAGGLHARRFREPFGDGELIAMCGASPYESRVLKKESNDVPMARARAAAECLDVTWSQRSQPAPRPAQRARCPRVDSFDGGLPRHKTSGQGADHSRVGHS
jgi:hypothetical protein